MFIFLIQPTEQLRTANDSRTRASSRHDSIAMTVYCWDGKSVEGHRGMSGSIDRNLLMLFAAKT